ncbi:hypothetical protein J1N35_036257 [Gossypium stocksii]|uniref:RNase H type-1 domain-containing protein n=1 Tax=Gossypium stocksii TaxID=47602 RepID=A0A9D3UHQ3_9ROSI|nr:hypothetical protein J1N35_036257 [Gossypium stocksii]
MEEFNAIWYNMNRMFHEGKRVLVHEIVGFINAYCVETKLRGEVLKSRNENNNNVWQPPRGDVIKINFDMSFNQNQHTSVSGIVAQNKEGLVMASCTFPWENIADPTTAKAKACLQVVTMAEEMGFQDMC